MGGLSAHNLQALHYLVCYRVCVCVCALSLSTARVPNRCANSQCKSFSLTLVTDWLFGLIKGIKSFLLNWALVSTVHMIYGLQSRGLWAREW